jgi:hypothetical protein
VKEWIFRVGSGTFAGQVGSGSHRKMGFGYGSEKNSFGSTTQDHVVCCTESSFYLGSPLKIRR